MNFTYVIDYQNKQNRTITVVYTPEPIPENEKALPTVAVLGYPQGATPEEIRKIILLNAPIQQWEEAISSDDVDIPLGKFEATTTEVEDVIEASIVPPTLEELKYQAHLAVDEARRAREQRGMPYVFPGDHPDRVQLRDDRDLTISGGRATLGLVLMQQGITDPVLDFRADSDTTYWMTPEQSIALSMAVAEYIAVGYRISWELKERIDAATTEEAVGGALDGLDEAFAV